MKQHLKLSNPKKNFSRSTKFSKVPNKIPEFQLKIFKFQKNFLCKQKQINSERL